MPKIVGQQMREATRRRILREAASEFARLGFDQATINTIAEQAGIGKGTMYLDFENTHALFVSMVRSIAQAHMRAIRGALALDGTLQERLERPFRAFARLAQVESDRFNVSRRALYGVNRAFKDEAIKLLREYLAVITFMLQQSQARGEFHTDHIEAMALLVLCLTGSSPLSARALGQSFARIAQGHALYCAGWAAMSQ